MCLYKSGPKKRFFQNPALNLGSNHTEKYKLQHLTSEKSSTNDLNNLLIMKCHIPSGTGMRTRIFIATTGICK